MFVSYCLLNTDPMPYDPHLQEREFCSRRQTRKQVLPKCEMLSTTVEQLFDSTEKSDSIGRECEERIRRSLWARETHLRAEGSEGIIQGTRGKKTTQGRTLSVHSSVNCSAEIHTKWEENAEKVRCAAVTHPKGLLQRTHEVKEILSSRKSDWGYF